jgi:hypothetical protein
MNVTRPEVESQRKTRFDWRKNRQKGRGPAGVIVNAKFVCFRWVIAALVLLATFTIPASAIDLGPFYDRFPLTMETGERTEILGPFFSFEKTETENGWTFSPLVNFRKNPGVEGKFLDIVYPIITHDQYGKEYRFQIFQIFSFAGGQTEKGETNVMKKRFTLFPLYFQQRSPKKEDNYTALFPIYGTLRNRVLRDYVHFIAFPIYVRTDKRQVRTDNYLLPFFHVRSGPGLKGWQAWPLVGAERKEVTTQTNTVEELVTVPGHKKFFALWPFFFNNHLGLGSTNQEDQLLVLPFYAALRSPARDTTAYGFPLGYMQIENRELKYIEKGAPWPFVVWARGEGKHVNRIWPIYSRAKTPTHRSDFIAWPLYKYNRVTVDPLDRERTRILFFLYSRTIERNTAAKTARKRNEFWPLYSATQDHNGNQRFQALALLEPLLPGNQTIERLYSPIWSVWRSEQNPKTGASSQSLLWNLYRRDETKTTKKVTALFGLFKYERGESGTKFKLFYIPFGGSKK